MRVRVDANGVSMELEISGNGDAEAAADLIRRLVAGKPRLWQMSAEERRPVVGYEGLYEVSSLGRPEGNRGE